MKTKGIPLVIFLFMTLTIIHAGSSELRQNSLTKDGEVQRNMIVSPLEVHFGDVLTDEIRVQLFEFTNTYGYPVEISHYVTADDGSVNLNLVGKSRADSLYFTVQPAQTEMVTLEYTPQSPGPWFCTLFVYNHISGELLQIPVDAFNVLNYYVTPVLMDFGNVNVGQTYNQILQIINPNSFDLNLDLRVSYILGGTDCIDLSIPGGMRPDSLTVAVPSEETLFVNVGLTPPLAGIGEARAWLDPLPPEPELVIIWVADNTPSWQEIVVNFGRVYVSSKVQDLRRLISDLNDPAIDVQAYIANHPNEVRLNVDGRSRFDPVTFQLQPGVPVDLGITFYPQQTGLWTDNLVFHDLTNDVYYYAPMSAEVYPATLNVFPPEINFGDVPLGADVQFPCDVHNPNAIPIPVGHFAFNGGLTELFVDGSPAADSVNYMLQPNETKQVFLIFHALQTGQWSGFMYCYDQFNHALYEINLSANVVIPPTLLIAPPDINFGNVFPNQFYYQPLDVHNQTDETLTIGHYVTGDDGSVNLNLIGKTWSDSVYYSVGPGETKHLEVRMALSELGPLSMMINAYVLETGELFQTPVSAIGVPALYVTPPIVDYGLTQLGSSYSQVVQVQNGSSSTMNISHYVTADDGSVNLNLVGKSRTDPLNYILLPGQIQLVEVVFTPQIPGLWDNNMMLTDNISGTVYFVPMHAHVAEPEPVLHIETFGGLVRLFWDEIPGATGYALYKSNLPEGPFIPYLMLPPGMTSVYADSTESRGFYRFTYYRD